MASKTPLSLLAQIRSTVSALGNAAGRTVRRVRDAILPPSIEAPEHEPQPKRTLPPAQEVPSPPAVAPVAAPVTEPPPPRKVEPAPRKIRTAPREVEPPSPEVEPTPPSAAEPAAGRTRTPSFVDPLGDTIAALRAVRRTFGGLELWPLPVRPWRTETELPPLPEGAHFDRHTFTCSAGSRDYRLYVPANSGTRPKGLVVMLHGCRQTPEDFAVGTRMNAAAEARGFLVLYPHQPTSANANGCWNWHRLSDQLRHGGEPAIIAGIIGELMETWGLARAQVFVAGLSAGGAMTAILTRTHPELFAAACIHSGVAAGLADDLRSGLAAMRGRFPESRSEEHVAPADIVPTIVFQGDADRVVHPSNADRIFADLDPTATDVRTETRDDDGVTSTVTTRIDADGNPSAELWHVAGGPHAWFGGDPAGSFAVPTGPDATGEMLRFFSEQGRRRAAMRDRAPRRRPLAAPATWLFPSQRDVR